MLEKDFELVIANHPNTVEATYQGTSTVGIFSEDQEKMFDSNGSYVFVKTIDFTYVTSKLPEISTKLDKFIYISGKKYLIRSNYRESKFITTLTIEESL